MENGVYTYGDLKEKLKNEKIKLELCNNTVLEVNGLTFATVNKIEIYKRKIDAFNIDTYLIIVDFLNDNNVVIAASYWGKFKTVFQMVMICLMIANLGGIFVVITQVVMWIAVALTIISLVDYLIKNKDVMKDTK